MSKRESWPWNRSKTFKLLAVVLYQMGMDARRGIRGRGGSLDLLSISRDRLDRSADGCFCDDNDEYCDDDDNNDGVGLSLRPR